MGARIWTIGYQGRSIDDMLDVLVREKVQTLVDVRIRAQSRRPGFSKTALAGHCGVREIEYQHWRSLGTPIDIRGIFRAGDVATARELYRDHLLLTCTEELEELAVLARVQRIAMMCFEFQERECHRLVVAEELERLHGLQATHLHT